MKRFITEYLAKKESLQNPQELAEKLNALVEGKEFIFNMVAGTVNTAGVGDVQASRLWHKRLSVLAESSENKLAVTSICFVEKSKTEVAQAICHDVCTAGNFHIIPIADKLYIETNMYQYLKDKHPQVYEKFQQAQLFLNVYIPFSDNVNNPFPHLPDETLVHSVLEPGHVANDFGGTLSPLDRSNYTTAFEGVSPGDVGLTLPDLDRTELGKQELLNQLDTKWQKIVSPNDAFSVAHVRNRDFLKYLARLTLQKENKNVNLITNQAAVDFNSLKILAGSQKDYALTISLMDIDDGELLSYTSQATDSKKKKKDTRPKRTLRLLKLSDFNEHDKVIVLQAAKRDDTVQGVTGTFSLLEAITCGNPYIIDVAGEAHKQMTMRSFILHAESLFGEDHAIVKLMKASVAISQDPRFCFKSENDADVATLNRLLCEPENHQAILSAIEILRCNFYEKHNALNHTIELMIYGISSTSSDELLTKFNKAFVDKYPPVYGSMLEREEVVRAGLANIDETIVPHVKKVYLTNDIDAVNQLKGIVRGKRKPCTNSIEYQYQNFQYEQLESWAVENNLNNITQGLCLQSPRTGMDRLEVYMDSKDKAMINTFIDERILAHKGDLNATCNEIVSEFIFPKVIAIKRQNEMKSHGLFQAPQSSDEGLNLLIMCVSRKIHIIKQLPLDFGIEMLDKALIRTYMEACLEDDDGNMAFARATIAGELLKTQSQTKTPCSSDVLAFLDECSTEVLGGKISDNMRLAPGPDNCLVM